MLTFVSEQHRSPTEVWDCGPVQGVIMLPRLQSALSRSTPRGIGQELVSKIELANRKQVESLGSPPIPSEHIAVNIDQ